MREEGRQRLGDRPCPSVNGPWGLESRKRCGPRHSWKALISAELASSLDTPASSSRTPTQAPVPKSLLSAPLPVPFRQGRATSVVQGGTPRSSWLSQSVPRRPLRSPESPQPDPVTSTEAQALSWSRRSRKPLCLNTPACAPRSPLLPAPSPLYCFICFSRM